MRFPGGSRARKVLIATGAAVLLGWLPQMVVPQDGVPSDEPGYTRLEDWTSTMRNLRGQYLNRPNAAVDFGPWFKSAPVVVGAWEEISYPSGGIDLTARDSSGNPVWQEQELPDGQVHNLEQPNNGVTHLARLVNSAQSRELTINLGSDDGFNLWLNGRHIAGKKVNRGVSSTDEVIALPLNQGENLLVLAIDNVGGGSSGFYFSADGEPSYWRSLLQDFPLEMGWLRQDYGTAGWSWLAQRDTSLEKSLLETVLERLNPLAFEPYANFCAEDPAPNDPGWLDLYVRFRQAEAYGQSLERIRQPLVTETELLRAALQGNARANAAAEKVLEELKSFPGRLDALKNRVAAVEPGANREIALMLARAELNLSLGLAWRTLFYVEKSAARPEMRAELEQLTGRVSAAPPAAVAQAETARDDVRALRRQIIFSHPLLDFDKLLITKAMPTLYSHQCDQYLGRHSRPAPGLVVLDGWKTNPRAKALLDGKLPKGAVLNPHVSYDAGKVVFAFCDHTEGDASQRRYFIYEAATDGSWVRQLTGTDADPLAGQGGKQTVLIEDFDPCYLPDGSIVFISTRNQGFGRCHGGRYTPSYVLYRMNADGTGIAPISFGEANEWNPRVLQDGRIIYGRWDYINRHDTYFQSLWVTRPDGTATAHFYGNYTRNPCMITEAKPVPGSHKVIATAMAHHSYTAGSVILIDPQKGVDGLEPVTRLTPESSFPETEGWPQGSYANPMPLSEEMFLAAYSPHRLVSQGGVQQNNAYGIYLVDSLGGRELIYSDPEVSCFSPIPLKPVAAPPVVPSVLAPGVQSSGAETGILYVQDVYTSSQNIPRGSIKAIRINNIIEQPTASVPHRSRTENEITKGVIGTVPVRDDGSAYFRVPADVPLQLQALDENGMAVMTMRSQLYVRPGEMTGCVGCHESRLSTPPHAVGSEGPARGLRPDTPRAPSWKTAPGHGFSFARAVQPVLDRHCIGCHGLQKENKGGISLLGTPESGFSQSFVALTQRGGLVKVAHRNSESDYSSPDDYFARGGGLAKMLLDGHADLDLDSDSLARIITWLDLNAQYYGDYSFNRVEYRQPSPEGETLLRNYIRDLFGDSVAEQPFAALVNVSAPEESRILKAPLAVSAGGWGQLKPVWPGTDSPAYRKMLDLVNASISPLPFQDHNGTCGRDHCVCGSCWIEGANLRFEMGRR